MGIGVRGIGPDVELEHEILEGPFRFELPGSLLYVNQSLSDRPLVRHRLVWPVHLPPTLQAFAVEYRFQAQGFQLEVPKFNAFALVVLQADVSRPVGLASGIQDLFAIEPHHEMVALNRDFIALPAVRVGGHRFGFEVVDQAAGGVAGVGIANLELISGFVRCSLLEGAQKDSAVAVGGSAIFQFQKIVGKLRIGGQPPGVAGDGGEDSVSGLPFSLPQCLPAEGGLAVPQKNPALSNLLGREPVG